MTVTMMDLVALDSQKHLPLTMLFRWELDTHSTPQIHLQVQSKQLSLKQLPLQLLSRKLRMTRKRVVNTMMKKKRQSKMVLNPRLPMLLKRAKTLSRYRLPARKANHLAWELQWCAKTMQTGTAATMI